MFGLLFEWPLKTGFTVHVYKKNEYGQNCHSDRLQHCKEKTLNTDSYTITIAKIKLSSWPSLFLSKEIAKLESTLRTALQSTDPTQNLQVMGATTKN